MCVLLEFVELTILLTLEPTRNRWWQSGTNQRIILIETETVGGTTFHLDLPLTARPFHCSLHPFLCPPGNRCPWLVLANLLPLAFIGSNSAFCRTVSTATWHGNGRFGSQVCACLLPDHGLNSHSKIDPTVLLSDTNTHTYTHTPSNCICYDRRRAAASSGVNGPQVGPFNAWGAVPTGMINSVTL